MRNTILVNRGPLFWLPTLTMVIILLFLGLYFPNLMFFLPFALVTFWVKSTWKILVWGSFWSLILQILFSFTYPWWLPDRGHMSGVVFSVTLALFVTGQIWRGVSIMHNVVSDDEVARMFDRGGLRFSQIAFNASKLSGKELSFFQNELSESYTTVQRLQEYVKYQMTFYPKAPEVNQFLEDFFAEIIKKPEKLALAGKFLYTDLPAYDALMTNYINLADNVIKTPADEEALLKAPAQLDTAYSIMRDDYVSFVDSERKAVVQGLSD